MKERFSYNDLFDFQQIFLSEERSWEGVKKNRERRLESVVKNMSACQSQRNNGKSQTAAARIITQKTEP